MVLRKIWQWMCNTPFYNTPYCNPCPTTMASPPPRPNGCHATIPPMVQQCNATDRMTGQHGRQDNGTKVWHVRWHGEAMGTGQHIVSCCMIIIDVINVRWCGPQDNAPTEPMGWPPDAADDMIVINVINARRCGRLLSRSQCWTSNQRCCIVWTAARGQRSKRKLNKQSAALHQADNGKGRWQGEMRRDKGGCEIIISKRVDVRSAREGVTHCCIADNSQTVSRNMCKTRCSRTVLVTHLLFIAIFFTHTSCSSPFFWCCA
jgi:hypothetical protein